jgi:hypothetical protein
MTTNLTVRAYSKQQNAPYVWLLTYQGYGREPIISADLAYWP